MKTLDIIMSILGNLIKIIVMFPILFIIFIIQLILESIEGIWENSKR
jgi:hypothetical protein